MSVAKNEIRVGDLVKRKGHRAVWLSSRKSTVHGEVGLVVNRVPDLVLERVINAQVMWPDGVIEEWHDPDLEVIAR